MKKEDWITEPARVSFTPVRSGDGYSFGGAAIVTIGPFALELGEHPQAQHLAKKIADRWNRGDDVTIDLAASLAAAISLLERGGKKAAPSDKMLDDYRGALARFRDAEAAK